MSVEDDFAIYQAVRARVASGVPAQREATRDEWMAVLRTADRLDAAVTALAEDREARQREAMSMGEPRKE